jgi:hypothetical protein
MCFAHAGEKWQNYGRSEKSKGRVFQVKKFPICTSETIKAASF